MKNRHLILIAAVFVIALSEVVAGQGTAGIRNPIGPGTAPPSSFSSGLIRSPNPIDTSGNLVITGNIRGGRYFRGQVPYQSGTSFRAPLGSTELDSFLRDSSGSGNLGLYSGRYSAQPYYSPSGSVTQMRPGQFDIFTPSNSRSFGGSSSGYGLESLPRKEISANEKLPSIDWTLRRMSLTEGEIERLASGETRRRPAGKGLTAEEYTAQMEMVQRDSQSLQGQIQDSTEGPSGQVASPEGLAQGEQGVQGTDLLTLKRQAAQSRNDGERTVAEQLAVIDQIRMRLGVLQREKDPSSKGEQADEGGRESGAEKGSPGLYGGQKAEGDSQQNGVSDDPAANEPEGYPAQVADESLELEKINSLSPQELRSRARQIMGPHKTFESFSDAKFDEHMTAALSHLKEGRFYRASSSCSMASVYRPKDASAYAIRSYALFAAGEYISSALFLSRALEISPEYAGSKVDVVALLGDRDKVESRIADVEEWLKRSNAVELEFLLGYMYYRLGRLELAQTAINSAFEKMPSSRAIGIVKAAVEGAIKSSQGE